MLNESQVQRREEARQLQILADAEMARRELARRHLLPYMGYVGIVPGFQPYPHIKLIADILEDVFLFIKSKGKEGIGRVMIFVSPQSGKSTIVSQGFPSWVLGKLPYTHIALTSYVSTLAERNSKKVRGIIEGEEFDCVFGHKSSSENKVALSKDSRSVSDWDLAPPHGGGLIARGVGGGITGYPLDLIVIDDPFKDRKDADSEASRKDVWDWYASAVVPRIRPTTAVILMHTRWHNDDLAGRLLKKMAEFPDDDPWKVVFLPAIALSPANEKQDDDSDVECYAANEEETKKLMERGVYLPQVDPLGRKPGESVCEEMFPKKYLEKRRREVGEREFSAVYQQTPKSKSGTMFPRDKVNIIPALPTGCVFMRYWDKAGTKGGSGARTSGVLMAKSPAGRFIVTLANAGRWASYDRNRQIRNQAVMDKAKHGQFPVWLEQEPGSGGKESAEISVKDLAGFDVHVETMSGQGSKELRAEPFSAQWHAGNVDLLVGDWNENYLNEMEDFPYGGVKDFGDASAGAFNKLVLAKPKRESRIY
jgi:predicted phage terminase large subunit-like protein